MDGSNSKGARQPYASRGLSGITDRVDFCVERNQPFGDDPNVVAQAFGDDVEVAPSGDAFLTNFLAEGCLHSPNFRGKASVDISKVCPNRSEFVLNLDVHVALGSNNPTIVVREPFAVIFSHR